jgi:hypothetical protein
MAKFMTNAKKPAEEQLKFDPENPFMLMSWDLVALHGPGYKVSDVMELLDKHNLPKEANEIQSRNAVLRALREAEKGSKDLVVLVDNDKRMVFQLTSISREDDERYGKIAKYLADAHIVFDKAKEELQCDNPKLLKYLNERFAVCQDYYKTHDITKILLRILQRHGDIMALRRKGGAYVVPSPYAEFAERARKFIEDLNPANTVLLFKIHGDKAAKADVANVLFTTKSEELERFRAELATLRDGDKERIKQGKKPCAEQPAVRKMRKQRLVAIKKKVALWGRVLQSENEELNELLKTCEDEMRKFFEV